MSNYGIFFLGIIFGIFLTFFTIGIIQIIKHEIRMGNFYFYHWKQALAEVGIAIVILVVMYIWLLV